MIWIHPTLLPWFRRDALFDQLMSLRGEVFREHKHRRTQQIRIGDTCYFLKQHRGTGWREIFRNLREGRLPVLDARREWRAIHRLKTLGIATLEPVGAGWRGLNPATRESFLLTRELPPHISLETLALQQKQYRLSAQFKWRLIKAVGTLAGRLHRHGVNHRDFYLCHLLIERDAVSPANQQTTPTLHVIDLHRAGVQRKTSLRWIVKDLGGLDFSSRGAGLTQRDRLRFQRAYEKAADRQPNPSFWKKVIKRGDTLSRRHGT